MTACPDDEDLSAFVEGRLDPDRRRAIEEHIDGCEACSQVVADVVRIFVSESESVPLSPIGDLRASQTDEGEQTVFSSEGGEETRDAPPLPAGSLVGRYQVLQCVGMGGMGVVYSAYDPQLDRRVALKVLRSGGQGKTADKRNARLHREAQAIARLSHPNVVTVHDVGHLEDGRVFLAMEFVDGMTLGQWLRAEKRSWQAIREVFIEAGRGLQAAHDGGLIHRDFKPDNLLIGHDGRARVTDFGLARWGDDLTSSDRSSGEESAVSHGPVTVSLTRTGALVGTPAYMAPEQYLRKGVTPACDQFSFCVTLFEALYGVRPFAGQTLSELSANVTAGRVRAVTDERAPAEIRRVVMRGLSVEPSDRFPDMNGLIEALQPRPTRSRGALWAWAIVPATLVGIGVAVYEESTPRPTISACARDSRVSDVWNERVHGELTASFVATGSPHAQESAAAVARHLDGFAHDWTALHRSVCARLDDDEAGLSTEALLQQHCLRDQQTRVRALVEVLSDADRGVVSRARQAVESLGSPERCAEPEQLRRDALTVPADLRERVESIEQMLAKVQALSAAGKYGEARDLCHAAHALSLVLGYAPLTAEVHLELGRTYAKLEQLERARDLLYEAVWLGVESGDRRVAASGWVDLVFLEGARTRDFAAAHRARRAAQAELLPLDGEPRLSRRLALHTATLALAEGRYLDARSLYQTILDDVDEGDRLGRAAVLFNLGNVAVGLDDPEGASQSFGEAAQIFAAEYGPAHPRVAAVHYNLGIAALAQGRYDDALASLELASAIEAESLSPTHPRRADTLGAMGSALLRLGRAEDAAARLREAVAIVDRPGEGLDGMAAFHRASLAQALTALGQPAAAQRVLLAAERNVAALDGMPHMVEAQLAVERGRVLLVSGELRRAQVALDKALQLGAREQGGDPAILPQVAELRARLELARGHLDDARQWADQAVLAHGSNGEPAEADRIRAWMQAELSSRDVLPATSG